MPLSSKSPCEERLQNGNNLLHTCTSQEEAQRLVNENIDAINALNDAGQAPIHSLMRLGNPETIPVINYLLTLAALRVNAQEPDGTTVAHLCEWGPIMSNLVVRDDFDPNIIRHSDGNTPLMFCITYNKNLDVVRRLLEDSRLDFEIRNPKNNKTAVEIAETIIAEAVCIEGDKNIENVKNILALIQQQIAARAANEEVLNPAQPVIFHGVGTATELPITVTVNTSYNQKRWSRCCTIS